MEYGSNIRKVEKAMKEALKNDRARLQIGRISGFGLMEMSRQRLRTGVLEATTRTCPHCDGTGLVRTASSAGLSALRLIEDEAAKGKGSLISLYASTEAAIYLLNAKRVDLAEIEDRYGVQVEVMPEGENEGAKMRVASSGPRPEFVPRFEPIVDNYDDQSFDDIDDEEEAEEAENRDDEAEGDGRRKRRKRRRGRGRDQRDEQQPGASDKEEDEDAASDDTATDASPAEAEGDGEAPRKRRRRGRRRRGGRGRGEDGGDHTAQDSAETAADGDANEEPDVSVEEAALPVASEVVGEAPAKPKRTRRKKADAEPEAVVEAPEEPAAEEAPAKPKRARRKKVDAEPEAATETPEEPVAEEAPAKPKRTRRKKVDAEAAPNAEPEASAEEAPAGPTGGAETEADDAGSPRRGWWQRTFGA